MLKAAIIIPLLVVLAACASQRVVDAGAACNEDDVKFEKCPPSPGRDPRGPVSGLP